MHHITRILYLALCVSGLVSGAFLLLCCFGVVDPALLFQREETAVLPTSAPAEVPQPEEAGAANAITLRTDQIDQAEALAVGHDTVVLPMQNEDGSLNYVSRLPLAVESGASWGDPGPEPEAPGAERAGGAAHRGGNFLPAGSAPHTKRPRPFPAAGERLTLAGRGGVRLAGTRQSAGWRPI